MGMAIDEVNNKIYVANRFGLGSVSIINAKNEVETMPNYFWSPVDVAYDSNSQLLYVLESYNSDIGKGIVKILSGTIVKETVQIDQYPVAMVLNKNDETSTKKIYVVYNSGNVQVIDTTSGNSVTTIDTAGTSSVSIAVNTQTNKTYVANGGSHNVTVIDGSTDTVVATISIEGSYPTPWGVAVNEQTNRIYVANQGGSVSVIDGNTNTVVQTIGIPNYAGPIGIATDSARNKIYVISNNTNDVTIIDGTVIEAAAVSGLTTPVLGGTPQINSDLSVSDNRYTVTGLTWENLDGGGASLEDGKFANGANTYQARIELTAAEDYRFPASGLMPTVNTGLAAEGTVDTNDLENTLTFVVTFLADIAEEDVSVLNLTPPATGEIPISLSTLASANSASDQYTVTGIIWEDTGGNPVNFADSNGEFPIGGSWFQAEIELQSKPGYKFPAGGLTPEVSGDGTASLGTVAGGDVSGNTLTFVVTFSTEINNIYIEGLTPPAVGETPQDMNTLTASNNCDVSNLTWQNSWHTRLKTCI